MTDTLVLFVPTHDTAWRWLRIAGDGVAGRGEGMPVLAADGEEHLVAVVPADAVTLHWAELPDRSLAQAVAAARLLAADASATPIGEMHVAVGREDALVERPIAVVAATQMRDWLNALADYGIDPDGLLPAPLLLPRPETGYVRADLGGAGVVRGPTSGFADEAGLTDLITGGVTPETLPRDQMEAAIVAAAHAPVLNLRQGPFSKVVATAIDWALIRRLAWLAGAVLAVTLLITCVQLLTYSLAADDLERRADVLARSGLARGEAVNDADRQLSARLERLRGGGLGFSRTAATVFAAMRATPGTEIRTLSFDSNGAMRVTVGVQNEGQILDLQRRIEASGLGATPMGQFQSVGGRVTGDIMVKPR